MTIKTTNIVSDIVELSTEDEKSLPNEVAAAISRNPTLAWIKFILADDAPNANKQRIPKEEFVNLIKTGVHMPIKMSQGYIRDGHEYSVPIGSITGLVEKEHHVEGIAGLWRKEFPGEVELLQEMASTEDNKPQISWELLYQDSVVENDVEAFSGVSLAAATVVGEPAYEGRTPIMLMASKEADSNYKIQTEEFDKMEEKLKELQSQIDTLSKEKTATATELSTLREEFDTLKTEYETIETERDELKEFKDGIDAEKALAEKIDTIKTLFSEAEVNLPDEYLEDEEKRNTLLAMDVNQLTFLLQDLALFASKEEEDEEEETEEEEASKHLGSSVRLNPKSDAPKEVSPKKIADALKNRDK